MLSWRATLGIDSPVTLWYSSVAFLAGFALRRFARAVQLLVAALVIRQ